MARMTISVTSATATTLGLSFGNLAADGAIELQVSPNPQFEFCICPIYTISRTIAYALSGLNRDGNYYLRARDRRADNSTQGWSDVAGARTASSGVAWP